MRSCKLPHLIAIDMCELEFDEFGRPPLLVQACDVIDRNPCATISSGACATSIGLHKAALKGSPGPRMVSPLLKREAVTVLLMDEHSFGATRACGLVQISASLYRYCSRRADCARLRERICDKRGHEAPLRYRGVHILLRRERGMVIRKLTCRLYREAKYWGVNRSPKIYLQASLAESGG